MVTEPNTGPGHNAMVFMIESQLEDVMGALRRLDAESAWVVEVRPEGRRADNAYLDETGRNTTLWPSSSWSSRRITREFDAEAFELAA
jgi:hypothetical protein